MNTLKTVTALVAALPIAATIARAADDNGIWQVWLLGSSTGRPLLACLELNDLREIERLQKTALGAIAVDRFMKTRMTILPTDGEEIQSCHWQKSGETFSSVAKKQMVPGDDVPYLCMELANFSIDPRAKANCIWVHARVDERPANLSGR
jgi:hypothetical protein